jgi:hypothetical protein
VTAHGKQNLNDAEACHLYGYWLMQQGGFDESLAELTRAAGLNPLSAGIAADVKPAADVPGKV